MLDFVETSTQLLSQGIFTVTGEHIIKVRLDGGSQSAVMPRPQFADARLPRLGGHGQNVVGLFEVKGKTHGIPAPLELSRKLGTRRVFQDIQLGEILPQKSQAKRDRSWHSETPPEITRRILAKIIIEAGVAAARCQQNSRQSCLLPPQKRVVCPRNLAHSRSKYDGRAMSRERRTFGFATLIRPSALRDIRRAYQAARHCDSPGR